MCCYQCEVVSINDDSHVRHTGTNTNKKTEGSHRPQLGAANRLIEEAESMERG